MPTDISEETKLYLSGLETASSRSRWVFYLLLISTCLIFAYNWKLNGRNWIDARIEWRQRVLEIMEKYDNRVELEKARPDLRKPKKLNKNQKEIPLEDQTSEELLSTVRKNYSSPLTEYGLDPLLSVDREILKDQLKDLNKEATATFKLPFMETDFDFNDFVFFSSTQLFILGFVLLYCLYREQNNLYLFFHYIGKMNKETAESLCRIAGLGQLFTVPGEIYGLIGLIKPIVLGLLIFPIFVIWWIFGWDVSSPNWWEIFNINQWANILFKFDPSTLDYQVFLYNRSNPAYCCFTNLESAFKLIFVLAFTLEMMLIVFYFLKLGWIWETKGVEENFLKYRLSQIFSWFCDTCKLEKDRSVVPKQRKKRK